jgi:nucleotidyltransferase substrate binding protein (TIGR01987 family)
MKQDYWKDSFELLGKSLKRLNEALKMSPGPERIVIDATMQRFEFTFELFWKNLKRFIELEGKEVRSPRETLKAAYALAWISDENEWLQMLTDRNLTSHTYREELADEVYARIKTHYSKMHQVYQFLSKKI